MVVGDGGQAFPGCVGIAVGGVEEADGVDGVVLGVELRGGLQEADEGGGEVQGLAVMEEGGGREEAVPLAADGAEDGVQAAGQARQDFRGDVVGERRDEGLVATLGARGRHRHWPGALTALVRAK